jgi:hypothetical protein
MNGGKRVEERRGRQAGAGGKRVDGGARCR